MADTPKQDRDNALPRENVGGRFVTKYQPGLALEICERVADGETLKEICEGSKKMPHTTTFHKWCVRYPDVAKAYRAARELSAYSLEEEALWMARQLKLGQVVKDQIRAYDVSMNQLRWSAGKRNAAVFSEKASVQFTVPVQINTSIDLGSAEGEAQVDHPDIYTIKATVTVDGEEQEVDAEVADPLGEAAKGKKAPKPPPRKRKRATFGPDAFVDE